MLFFNFKTYLSPYSTYLINLCSGAFKISYLYINHYWNRTLYYLFPSFRPKPIPTIMTLSKDFSENEKIHFINSIENTEKNWNESIDKLFYIKKMYKQSMKEKDNELEKKWKANVLYNHTPRGNIIMYYDAFKLGFVYMCDTSVTYDILNALAMKYVIRFRCLDFFVDNSVYEKNNSPFIDLYFKEDADKDENKEETKEDKKKKENSQFIKDNKDVFIKRAKVETKKQEIKQETKQEEKKEPEKEIICNKFINNGKISNFSFIQKEKKIVKTNGFNSTWVENLNQESNLQKETFNYKDFKNMRK